MNQLDVLGSNSLYINNQWIEGKGEALSSINPANDQAVWQKNVADNDQVNSAVAAARSAFPDWSRVPLEKRIDYCQTFAKLLSDHKQTLAQIISQEVGKPVWESLTEVGAMIAKIDISIKSYHQRTGSSLNQEVSPHQQVRHKPHGVLAVFGPYNFPGHLPNGHIAPALIAGNTIIFKPSEQTPKVAEFMMWLWQQTDLPKGVLNMIQGNVPTSQTLAQHGEIDGLLFTGSAQTGTILHQQFAAQPEKILALEMGGNNPLIVKDYNHDMQAIIYLIIQSAYMTTGQRCTCSRRLYLPDTPQTDELLEKLSRAVGQLKIGDAQTTPDAFMGPVVNKGVAKKLAIIFSELEKSGGKVLNRLEHTDVHSGFVSPGLIDMSGASSSIDEEYFGPILQVFKYTDFDEAIKSANNTRYGLAAGLIGGEQKDFDYFFDRIRAGVVNWNTQTTGASSAAPFGGLGASGNHRPSAFYAADYCAYPVASLLSESCQLPATLSPGVSL